MKILVTGAKGFVGKNLVESLKNIRDGKDRTHPFLNVSHIYEYDVENTREQLEEFCRTADFVFHLAGVNRPKNTDDFVTGNVSFSEELLLCLKKSGNRCPVLFTSSIQATLSGRFQNSDYGRSKLTAEKMLIEYAQDSGASVLLYRLPNLFGKWCRPNYNSVVATFCYNTANDLPLRIDDPNTELELLYIDDLIEEFLKALSGQVQHCEYHGDQMRPDPRGNFCCVPCTHKVTLGTIVELLKQYHDQPQSLFMPAIPANSFEKKLYSTYLSYLPKEKAIVPYRMNEDDRGSFTELIKTAAYGQFSVNILKPGITKGQHWHHSKWELFVVVSGHGLIQQRKIGSDEVLDFEVSGEKIQAVHMLPGYTHNIMNLSEHENLVTLMWANEPFDPEHLDTFYEVV